MGRKRKYTLNENYFNDIDSKDKAYILGFIYADGSVYNNYLNIGIHKRDVSVLNFIKKEMRYNGPLYINGEYVKLTISSKKIVNSLKELGIIRNKTYVSKKLPQITTHLLPSFLLGFFDGDGSIYKSGPIKYDYTVNFTNNLEVLSELKNFLLTHTITSSKVRMRHDNEISCMLDIRGSKNIEKIFDLFYTNPPNYFFSRKKNKFNKFKESLKSVTRRNISDELITEIKNMYLNNIRQIDISDKLGLPYSSVRCVIQRLRRLNVLI